MAMIIHIEVARNQQIISAKKMIAAADAAEASAAWGSLSDEELKKLGYVETEGGVWELPIPVHICKMLATEDCE